MECIHLLIQVAELKVQKTKGVEVKVSTAFHFHLTDPVKPRAWMSANHYYTAGCILWPSSIAEYARASSAEPLLAFQRAECLPAPGLTGREVPGAAGAPQPTCLDLALLWPSGILLLFGSPQVEGGFLSPVQLLVVPKGSGVESHSQICWFPTKKQPWFSYLLCILQSCLVHHSFPLPEL